MNDIQFRKNYSAWIGSSYPVRPESGKTEAAAAEPSDGEEKSFSSVLQKVQQDGLVFSKHALQRMEERQIEISPEVMTRMSSAVEQARSKGVREALMLGENTAFIVNIPNSTVVTMMNGGEMKENLFTNIDGAVIL